MRLMACAVVVFSGSLIVAVASVGRSLLAHGSAVGGGLLILCGLGFLTTEFLKDRRAG
jgi:uncharacterized membrane protein YgdD (TMEM256/DUF423 family)